MVAHRADVDAHRVEGLDRGLVVEEAGDQRAGADVVAGADDQRVAVLLAQVVDVRGQVLGAAGRGAHAARQRDRARRREVAVEVVDAQQLDVHRARLVALVVSVAVVAAVGLGGRGGDEQRRGDGEEEGARSHDAVLHPHGDPAVKLRGALLQVPAEAEAHRRQRAVAELALAARLEARVEAGRDDGGGDALVDGGQHGPAPFARVRDAAGEALELGVLGQRLGGEVQQPRGDHAAAPPDLRDLGDRQVVHVGLGIAQRRRLGVVLLLLGADVGALEDVQPLRVGAHHPVLDPVVDHLHEVPGAGRAAVQIALLGGRRVALATRACAARRRRRGPAC